MKKLLTTSLRNVKDLIQVMKMPLERVHFVHPDEMFEVIHKPASQSVTVHAYRLEKPRGKEKSILDYTEYYSQAYIAIDRVGIGFKGPIYRACCILTGGRSSGKRELHNQMINAFLASPELVSRTSTSVLVFHKRDLIASYTHPSYAYVNHDIGTNWDMEKNDNIEKRIADSGLPSSEIRGNIGQVGSVEVIFSSCGNTETVYKAIKKAW